MSPSFCVYQSVGGEPTWSKLSCYSYVVVNMCTMLANSMQESFQQE
jgi:hypothetical protein